MDRRNLFAILVSLSLAAGCGGSPSSPSSGSVTSSLAAESAVMSAMTQAMSQLAIVGRTSSDTPSTFSMPCAGGGTIVITLSATLPSQQTNVYRSASRTEFRDCKNQTVTLNGDPYLETSAEHSFPTPGGTGGDSISTLQTTGGMRIDSGGVQGRVQLTCTMTVSVRSGNGSPQVSSTSSGTITFEQPLGSPPVVRPCGPA